MSVSIDPISSLLGTWAAEFNVYSVTLRVALSILLIAIIGCERASKRHAAGLRTFVLVSLSSTLAMLMDDALSQGGTNYHILSAASIVGVSIIAINSILFSSRSQIKGLTTSVGLWSCGIIGLTVGAGYYTMALIAFAALLCCLSLLPVFEVYLKNRSNHFEVHIELTSPKFLPDFVTTVRKLGMKIDDIEANPAYVSSGLSVYSVSISISSDTLRQYKSHREIIRALGTLEYLSYIEEIDR